MAGLKPKLETQALDNLDKIAGWLEDGATMKAVAKKLKISYSTLRRWLDKGQAGEVGYAEFYRVFMDSRAVADEAVEHALFDRACGMRYDEDTYERAPDPVTGEPVMVLKKRVTKFLPPDVSSALFWLTNRMPGRYRYKPDAVTSATAVEGGVVVIPEVMQETMADGCEKET